MSETIPFHIENVPHLMETLEECIQTVTEDIQKRPHFTENRTVTLKIIFKPEFEPANGELYPDLSFSVSYATPARSGTIGKSFFDQGILKIEKKVKPKKDTQQEHLFENVVNLQGE